MPVKLRQPLVLSVFRNILFFSVIVCSGTACQKPSSANAQESESASIAAPKPQIEAAWKELLIQSFEASSAGNLSESLRHAIDAKNHAKTHFGENHSITIQSTSIEGTLHARLGNFSTAETLLQRTSKYYLNTLGNEHETTKMEFKSLNLVKKFQKLETQILSTPEVFENPTVWKNPQTLNDLLKLSEAYEKGLEYDKALSTNKQIYNLAVKMFGEKHPNTNIGKANIGAIHILLGNYEDARRLYVESLASLEKTLGIDHPQSTSTRNSLAAAYKNLGRFGEAESLLRINTKISNSPLDTMALATLLQLQGRFSEAGKLHNEVIDRLANNHPIAITSANNLALIYQNNNNGEAEKLYRKTLDNIGDNASYKLSTLDNLANYYFSTNRLQEAKSTYEEVVSEYNRILGPDHPDTIIATVNLASLYDRIGLNSDAKALFNNAMKRSQNQFALNNKNAVQIRLLFAYHLLLDSPEPVPTFLAKTTLAKQFRSRETIYKNSSLQKASLDHLYRNRTEIIQSLFLTASPSRYSEAELLGRVSKLRDPSLGVLGTAPDEVIPLTPLEREWDARLSVMHKPGPDGQEVSLEVYTQRMDAWLEEVAAIDEDVLRADHESFGTSLQDGMLSELSKLGDDVGMLQIASFKDETYFFVLTPKGRFQHHKRNIGQEKITELIFKARDQLGMNDPDRSSRDTIPGTPTRRVSKAQLQNTLKDLNSHLMPGQVRTMLEDAGIKHLVLNLQGRIRYAPFAALYDGDKYLSQRFDGLSRFTWGGLDYEAPQKMFSNAAGFGMSEKARVGEQSFKALPGVETELNAIFATDGSGVLPGVPLLNTAFTREALVEAMAQQPSVLHISSHFEMRPGQDAGDSYLLLGDGTPLTLNEVNAAQDITFEGVDLLVLSACSTARSTEGSGIEVEGLGAIAQLKGADAVMATLWNVADESTSKFMAKFYSELQKPNVDKAQAIKNTQNAFINGTIKSSDSSKDYSEPYYWAPYVLMGNWK